MVTPARHAARSRNRGKRAGERAGCPAAKGAKVFVHDFVMVEQPADHVVGQFAQVPDTTLAVLARSAWSSERDTWAQLGLVVPDLSSGGPPIVRLGTPWIRDETSVVPMTWRGDDEHPCFPDLEADLEIVTERPGWTSVHLVGEYELRPLKPDPHALRRHRATLVGLRRFLQSLCELLEGGCTSVGITAPSLHPR